MQIAVGEGEREARPDDLHDPQLIRAAEGDDIGAAPRRQG
jgi:hypothetical protein